MSSQLPFELRILILSYLPLKHIQKYGPITNDVILKQLLRNRYSLDNETIQKFLVSNGVLSKYDKFIQIAYINDDVGYDGHLYIDIHYCLLAAVKLNDFELTKYYVDRMESLHSNIGSLCLYYALMNKNIDIVGYLYTITPGVFRGSPPIPTNQIELLPYNRGYYSRTDIINVDPITEFLTLDIAKINKANSVPFVDSVKFSHAFNGLILKKHIDAAAELYNFLPLRFPSSKNLSRYLDLLAILLNKPFDLVNFGARERVGLYNLAISVLNYDAMVKINFQYNDGNDRYQFLTSVSEVLYDLDKVSTIPYPESKIIVLSIWNDELQKLFNYFWNKITPLEETIDRGTRIEDAETAKRVLEFGPIEAKRLIPKTYIDYSNMKAMGLPVKVDQKLETEYLSRQKKLARVLGIELVAEPSRETSTCTIN